MSTSKPSRTRREFSTAVAGGAIGAISAAKLAAQSDKPNPTEFKFRYMLASCMFGYQYLGEILPQVALTGATAIDIWPKVHGNQREQLADLGEERFAQMLAKHKTQLGCITQYPLGPFGLQSEMKLSQRLGCTTLVTGGKGPVGQKGSQLKQSIVKFIEQLKPHLAVAEQTGVTISIENHANNLIDSPDSLKWLAELRPSSHLSIALAPYHLPQDPKLIGDLVETLGDSITIFYAWEHGKGCHKPMPKTDELLQLPGRGSLDFGPIVDALRRINYNGWTEIFMHPTPRGLPMLPMAKDVAAEINRARVYLESLI